VQKPVKISKEKKKQNVKVRHLRKKFMKDMCVIGSEANIDPSMSTATAMK